MGEEIRGGDSVGTQWETCGKNRRQGLGTKGFAQKKVLSLVLCVAMLLSVMVMALGRRSRIRMRSRMPKPLI